VCGSYGCLCGCSLCTLVLSWVRYSISQSTPPRCLAPPVRPPPPPPPVRRSSVASALENAERLRRVARNLARQRRTTAPLYLTPTSAAPRTVVPRAFRPLQLQQRRGCIIITVVFVALFVLLRSSSRPFLAPAVYCPLAVPVSLCGLFRTGPIGLSARPFPLFRGVTRVTHGVSEQVLQIRTLTLPAARRLLI
jgi:hypothetical protein